MMKRIEQLVFDSFGSQLYAKALKCVEAFREECVKVENLTKLSNQYNT